MLWIIYTNSSFHHVMLHVFTVSRRKYNCESRDIPYPVNDIYQYFCQLLKNIFYYYDKANLIKLLYAVFYHNLSFCNNILLPYFLTNIKY